MLSSLSNCIRTVVRHAPPLRAALPLPATGLRWFSVAGVTRNGFNPNILDEDLTEAVSETAEMVTQDAALRGESVSAKRLAFVDNSTTPLRCTAASPAFAKTVVYEQNKTELQV